MGDAQMTRPTQEFVPLHENKNKIGLCVGEGKKIRFVTYRTLTQHTLFQVHSLTIYVVLQRSPKPPTSLSFTTAISSRYKCSSAPPNEQRGRRIKCTPLYLRRAPLGPLESLLDASVHGPSKRANRAPIIGLSLAGRMRPLLVNHSRSAN